MLNYIKKYCNLLLLIYLKLNIDHSQSSSHHVSSDFKLFPNKTYINGKWSDSVTNKTFEVHDPATNKLLGHVPDCTKDDLDLAVKAADDAFQTWRNFTAEVNPNIHSNLKMKFDLSVIYFPIILSNEVAY